jgi:SAM-dependent methyltransferase
MALLDTEHKQLVRDCVLDEDVFVRAVFSGQQRGQTVPWQRVVLRPVMIKDKRHIQVSHFDARRDVTKNFSGREAAAKLDELLDLPFKNLYVQTIGREIKVQFTKKGKALVHSRQVSTGSGPSLDHDRRKDLLLPVGAPDPFLQAIGIMTREGQVRARMRNKFRQINEFCRLVLEMGVADLPRSIADTSVGDTSAASAQRPLRIVDCGCGNAYLSFAVYHYLNHVLHVPTHLVGIDVNHTLIGRRSRQVQELGWQDLTFQTTRIAEYDPGFAPDVVLALHACDTATDEALAQAVKWRSEMIFAVPCCHHHLQERLGRQPPLLRPVYRHGILKERLGDVLTDALRAQILRLVGYRAEVIQFISSEHTDKNLMIRAVRSEARGSHRLSEYKELKAAFQVTPFLEHLLAPELSALGLDVD